MRKHGTIAWNELMTSDPEKAMSFFGETLGWTFAPFPMGEGQYWIIQSGDEMVGGLTGLGGSDIKTDRSYWLTSMEVDDVDASWATALAAGAQGVMSPQDVPEVGRVAVLIDPTGIPFGIMKGLQPME